MAPDPKKAKRTNVAKTAGKGNANTIRTPMGSSTPQKEAPQQGWEWAPFTKKAVTFNQAAKTLAAEIMSLFGNTVSITQFEKFCVAADSMSPEEQNLIHLNASSIQALQNYIRARDERDSERASFGAIDVEGALASLLTSIAGDGMPPTGEIPKKDNTE